MDINTRRDDASQRDVPEETMKPKLPKPPNAPRRVKGLPDASQWDGPEQTIKPKRPKTPNAPRRVKGLTDASQWHQPQPHQTIRPMRPKTPNAPRRVKGLPDASQWDGPQQTIKPMRPKTPNAPRRVKGLPDASQWDVPEQTTKPIRPKTPNAPRRVKGLPYDASQTDVPEQTIKPKRPKTPNAPRRVKGLSYDASQWDMPKQITNSTSPATPNAPRRMKGLRNDVPQWDMPKQTATPRSPMTPNAPRGVPSKGLTDGVSQGDVGRQTSKPRRPKTPNAPRGVPNKGLVVSHRHRLGSLRTDTAILKLPPIAEVREPDDLEQLNPIELSEMLMLLKSMAKRGKGKMTSRSTPQESIYRQSGVSKNVEMLRFKEKQALRGIDTQNARLSRRIENVKSDYSRDKQLKDFKKHQGYVASHRPVANLKKQARTPRNGALCRFNPRCPSIENPILLKPFDTRLPISETLAQGRSVRPMDYEARSQYPIRPTTKAQALARARKRYV